MAVSWVSGGYNIVAVEEGLIVEGEDTVNLALLDMAAGLGVREDEGEQGYGRNLSDHIALVVESMDQDDDRIRLVEGGELDGRVLRQLIQ